MRFVVTCRIVDDGFRLGVLDEVEGEAPEGATCDTDFLRLRADVAAQLRLTRLATNANEIRHAGTLRKMLPFFSAFWVSTVQRHLCKQYSGHARSSILKSPPILQSSCMCSDFHDTVTRREFLALKGPFVTVVMQTLRQT